MTPDITALLVEDNPGDAKLVEHHLQGPMVETFFDDVSLTHVETLSAAEAELGSTSYDVIMLDLGLESSSGLETLERAKEIEHSRPIIVLTGLDDPEAATEAITVGAQDFLPKGELDGDRLVRSLRYAIDRHEQEQRLQRQTERMDFFNSVLRHDMLNGLNIIMAQADMLEHDLEDEDQLERATAIREWSEDITDLAKKVRAVLETVTDSEGSVLEPVSLVEAVREQIERAESATDRVTFEADMPETSVVQANDLLDDVIGNLLMNAVEHTDGDRHVDVTLADDGHTAQLRIADDGDGIDPSRHEEIFGRGNKGEASTGTGFGLFFVSSMVESYGGTVEALVSDTGGAAFEVCLPVAAIPGQ